ncbi:polyprotein [Hirsutella rhossiliensis]
MAADDLEVSSRVTSKARQLQTYKDKTKALAKLQEHIVKTVGKYYDIIAKEDDVAKELTILKNRVKPTDWARESEVTDRYYATLKAVSRSKVEEWISKWQVVLNEAKNLDLPDVKDLRPTRHFLKAVNAIDSTFSKVWINQMEANALSNPDDDWQKTFPDGIKISEIFERSYRSTTSNSDTKGWSPDSKVQEEIDQKLKDPTTKGKIERSIRNRKRKEESRQESPEFRGEKDQEQEQSPDPQIKSAFSTSPVYPLRDSFIMDSGSDFHICNNSKPYGGTNA